MMSEGYIVAYVEQCRMWTLVEDMWMAVMISGEMLRPCHRNSLLNKNLGLFTNFNSCKSSLSFQDS